MLLSFPRPIHSFSKYIYLENECIGLGKERKEVNLVCSITADQPCIEYASVNFTVISEEHSVGSCEPHASLVHSQTWAIK